VKSVRGFFDVRNCCVWVPPDRVTDWHWRGVANGRIGPIPNLYRRPESFTGADNDRQRRELAEMYNWGVYCGFHDGVGIEASEFICNQPLSP